MYFTLNYAFIDRALFALAPSSLAVCLDILNVEMQERARVHCVIGSVNKMEFTRGREKEINDKIHKQGTRREDSVKECIYRSKWRQQEKQHGANRSGGAWPEDLDSSRAWQAYAVSSQFKFMKLGEHRVSAHTQGFETGASAFPACTPASDGTNDETTPKGAERRDLGRTPGHCSGQWSTRLKLLGAADGEGMQVTQTVKH